MPSIQSICVFCGSSFGARPAYKSAAEELGRSLADRNIQLVYGGGCVGLMGAIADAALAGGGKVIGVIPDSLIRREVGHRGLTKLHVVETMHQRKALMADLSDAFIALPGGFGTLEEMFEIVTWSQLGIQHKPCGLLNVAHYWDDILRAIDRAVTEQFLRPESRDLVLVDERPAEMLEKLHRWLAPPHLKKGMDEARR